MPDSRADAAFEKSRRCGPAAAGDTRIERDGLGERRVPSAAYWGINVERARDNFSISGRAIAAHPDFIFGYASVKQAAARANAEIGARLSALESAHHTLRAEIRADIKDLQELIRGTIRS